ncbi:MAG: esterase [Planctomycetes bacterium]|nr:esterase [Planctomycetota bacterium]
MAAKRARGQLRRLVYESQVLRTNPLGDPSERDLWCYLPPGFDESQRYPVLFVLAGYLGRGRGELSDGAWSPPLDERLDRMHATFEAEPVIVVFPDCQTRLGGSQYLNSQAIGRYEDYVCDELVPFVDAQLPTKGDGHRGVLGKSSGGYGALRLAMRRPGVFHGVASHSGDCAFDLVYAPDFANCARQIAASGGIDAFLEAFFGAPKKRQEQIEAFMVLAMSAAYSPLSPAAIAGMPADPDKKSIAATFELPFDLTDLRRKDPVWKRWLANDPIEMLDTPSHADALRQLRVLFVDVGTRDEYNLDFGARRLRAKMDALGIRHRYEEFDDGHRGLSYRFERSIPLLSRMLT